MTKDDRRLEAASARLRQAIINTITGMSREPIEFSTITSRDDLITKATDGLITIDIYETPAADRSSLSDEEAGLIYHNVDSLLGSMTDEEIEIARYRADRALGIQ